jgi:ribosomal protein S25
MDLTSRVWFHVGVSSVESLVARVRAEYREMPGLSLTAAQASRLCGINVSVCEQVLRELVVEGVLHNTSSGAYVAGPPTRERR